MPNGDYVLNDLEFDQKIKAMDGRELQEFTARLAYGNSIKIHHIEKQNRKRIGLTGGAGVFVGGIIVGIGDFLRRMVYM